MRMNRTLLFIILFSLILTTLTGCTENSYPFKEPIDEIKHIEIVSVESSLDFTVIKTLSEEEKNVFIEQFKKIKFQDYLGDPPEVYGDAIKITYQNGLYEMICSYAAEYVENGVIQFRWKACDEKVFNELIENFLKDS
jgi:hypothetical protein